MYKLPELPYPYDALEPIVDAETMRFHHDKHHQTYLDKLNNALEKYPNLFEKTPEELVSRLDLVPLDIREAIRNFGGGFVNHNLFWECLGPKKDNNAPAGALATAIEVELGGFEAFKKELSEKTVAVFGSGYGWLYQDSQKRLHIGVTANQDTPLMCENTPLLCIDVWEHAYYLKYKNARAEFVEKIFEILDWEKINERYRA